MTVHCHTQGLSVWCEKHPTAELASPPTEYRPDNSRSAQVSVIRRSEASLAVTSVEIVQIFTSPI